MLADIYFLLLRSTKFKPSALQEHECLIYMEEGRPYKAGGLSWFHMFAAFSLHVKDCNCPQC